MNYLIEKKVTDEDVIVKVSICQKCNGRVRSAIKHLMSKSMVNEFSKEAFEYNLLVKEYTLPEFRKLEINQCVCS